MSVDAFIRAFDAWVSTEPESVIYPSPADYSELDKMMVARRALDIPYRPKVTADIVAQYPLGGGRPSRRSQEPEEAA